MAVRVEDVVRTETLDPEKFDIGLSPDLLTDKDQVRIQPCRTCRRACIVSTFVAVARTECRACRGGPTSQTGQMVSVQPGKTPPENASRLSDCLINKQFAHAICPFDPDHDIELKSVNHSEHRGPQHFVGTDRQGQPIYKNDVGETAMLQCNDCRTVISISTAHTAVYRRQNEPRRGVAKDSAWSWINGEREAA